MRPTNYRKAAKRHHAVDPVCFSMRHGTSFYLYKDPSGYRGKITRGETPLLCQTYGCFSSRGGGNIVDHMKTAINQGHHKCVMLRRVHETRWRIKHRGTTRYGGP